MVSSSQIEYTHNAGMRFWRRLCSIGCFQQATHSRRPMGRGHAIHSAFGRDGEVRQEKVREKMCERLTKCPSVFILNVSRPPETGLDSPAKQEGHAPAWGTHLCQVFVM